MSPWFLNVTIHGVMREIKTLVYTREMVSNKESERLTSIVWSYISMIDNTAGRDGPVEEECQTHESNSLLPSTSVICKAHQ